MLVENNQRTGQITVGADKGYDARDFVEQCRLYGVTPHIAQNTSRTSAVDERTTRRVGYSISQRIRKRVEEIFGWTKTVGGLRRTRFKGVDERSSRPTSSAPPTISSEWPDFFQHRHSAGRRRSASLLRPTTKQSGSTDHHRSESPFFNTLLAVSFADRDLLRQDRGGSASQRMSQFNTSDLRGGAP